MNIPIRSTSLMVLTFSLLLAACGFHLRNTFALPFQKLYVKSVNDNSPFINELKISIRANNVQVTDTAEQAELTLQIVSEVTDKQILSLSASGTVLEYRLQYRISLRAYDQKLQEWLAPQEITVQRNYNYDNNQVLAMMQEETMLYQNMRSDAVQQVMRRLNHAHPSLPQ